MQVLLVFRAMSLPMRVPPVTETSQLLLELLINSIPYPVFWKDRTGLYLGCNPAFARAMGRDQAQQVIGCRDGDFTHLSSEDVAYLAKRERLVMEQGVADLHTIEPRTGPTGHPTWINCSRQPIIQPQAEGGQVVGLLGSFFDITPLLATQRMFKTRERQLATLLTVQRQLLKLDWEWSPAQVKTMLAYLTAACGASHATYVAVVAQPPGQAAQVCPVAHWSASKASKPMPSMPEPWNQVPWDQVPWDQVPWPWPDPFCPPPQVVRAADQLAPALQALLALPAPTPDRHWVVLLPLVVAHQLQGVVALMQPGDEQPWDQAEIDLLQVALADVARAIEHHQMEASLQETEASYRSLFENAVEGIFRSTPEGRYLTANPMLASIYGYDSVDDLMANLTDIRTQLYVNPQQQQRFTEQVHRTGAVIGFESEVYRKDGSTIWIAESAWAVRDRAGQVVAYEGTVNDITTRKQTEAAIVRRDRLLQGVAEASQCLLTNRDLPQAMNTVLATLGAALDADRAYIYEHHPHSETGTVAMTMRHEWTRQGIPPTIHQPHWHNQPYTAHGLERWYAAFAAGKSICGLVREFPPAERDLLGQDDIRSILMVPIYVDDHLWGYIGLDACQEDHHWTGTEESTLVVTAAALGTAIKRQIAEAKISYQAYHDALTNLPNRAYFNQQLPLAIHQAQQQQTMLAVVFIDLDHFKTINDTLGHVVGDQLLQKVASRLAQSLRREDLLARWGGDEFTLILTDIRGADHVTRLVQRFSDCLRPVFQLKRHSLHITSSIGIALYPQDGQDMTTLMQHADAAMYQAKAQGRNSVRFYTLDLSAAASSRLLLENSLHHALDRHELMLHYQPQVDVATGSIIQVEALVRWQHPDMGMVSPHMFIPLAEENGLILAIGEWVLTQACRQLVTWHRQGHAHLRVAVNLSARQLQHPQLIPTVSRILQHSGLPAAFLELEITETAAMGDIKLSIAALKGLRQLGISISMDDFGTGYSCLSYLKDLPLDGLKIDRAFVKDLPKSDRTLAMVSAIVAMAKGLHLDLVAEGIETQEQLNCLRAIGCSAMQGYYFSRPVPAEVLTALLTTAR